MRQALTSISLRTVGPNLYEFTDQVTRWTRSTGIHRGLLTIYIRHTSASLLIQENADPDVRTDLQAFLRRLIPEGDPLYIHTLEGPDDMPAHVKCALSATSLSIPVDDGLPTLGAWQGIYLWEHRRSPHTRKVVLHLLGE
ncbi:MAG: secondary thiamine-phosphate synthase enzyme YjbQ [Bryobacterales bacterium]|jgi:secondary thiamine-phosphate synthase enzyme|nr:secondary thiamine-phosphate synthase enzyme YjbQ [Bryobacterales bacterium]